MKSNRFLISTLVFALSGGLVWAADVSPQRQIAVTGEAQIQVPPSLAMISLAHAYDRDGCSYIIDVSLQSYAPQPQPPLGLGKYTKSCIISLAFLILG